MINAELIIEAYLVGGFTYWLAQFLDIREVKRLWKERTGKAMTTGFLVAFLVMILCMCLPLWPYLLYRDFTRESRNQKEGKS